MKKRDALLLLLVLLLAACSSTDTTLQLEKARHDLHEATTALEKAEAELEALRQPRAGELMHIVYFNLKDDLSAEEQAAFLAEVGKLRAIDAIQDLQFGPFADLGDSRALSDFEVVMQMSFAGREDYDVYQNHPLHLALKEKTKPYMGGTPATYDFWVRE